jgi:hypothetical protein
MVDNFLKKLLYRAHLFSFPFKKNPVLHGRDLLFDKAYLIIA